MLSVFVAANQLELSLTDQSIFEATMNVVVPDAGLTGIDSGVTLRVGLAAAWFTVICCEVAPAPLTVISAERVSTLEFTS